MSLRRERVQSTELQGTSPEHYNEHRLVTQTSYIYSSNNYELPQAPT